MLRTKPVPNTFPSNVHSRAGCRGEAALQALLCRGVGHELPGCQARQLCQKQADWWREGGRSQRPGTFVGNVPIGNIFPGSPLPQGDCPLAPGSASSPHTPLGLGMSTQANLQQGRGSVPRRQGWHSWLPGRASQPSASPGLAQAPVYLINQGPWQKCTSTVGRSEYNNETFFTLTS